MNVKTPHRGLHRFGKLALETAAPFGLIRRRRWFSEQLSVLVYPRWVPMKRVGLVENARGKSEHMRVARGGGESSGSRRYEPGDPLRIVHWRNTARTGRPTVRQYETTTGNATVLVLDTSNVRGVPGDTTLDYGARIAASVARALTRSGTEVELLTDARRVSPTRDWRQIMKSLALLKETPGPSVAGRLQKLTDTGTIFAVVCSRDVASISALAQLSRRGAAVAAVVLEGFEPADDAETTISLLRDAGAAVTSCRRGTLEETIVAIERGDGSVLSIGGEVKPSANEQLTDLAA
jgi:uncharacterized protein (DUF58 family)